VPICEEYDEVEAGLDIVEHLPADDEAGSRMQVPGALKTYVAPGVVVGLQELAELVPGDDLLKIAGAQLETGFRVHFDRPETGILREKP
jgi:hypothetical protein